MLGIVLGMITGALSVIMAIITIAVWARPYEGEGPPNLWRVHYLRNVSWAEILFGIALFCHIKFVLPKYSGLYEIDAFINGLIAGAVLSLAGYCAYRLHRAFKN